MGEGAPEKQLKMGKKATLLLMHLFLVIATYIVAGFTIAGWFAGMIPPQRSWFITLLSLGMTPLLGLNLLLMLWWVCKRKLLAVLPLGVMLLNIGFITAMVQVNFRNETGRIADLKIATYNIHGFAQKELKSTMSNIAGYLASEKVDVVCFQEFKTTPACPLDTIRAAFAPVMPYCAAIAQESGIEIAIFSRYPISSSCLFPFAETANSAMWADIEVDGRPLRIFNVHFQTTSISQSKAEIERLREKGITDRDGKKAFDLIMERMRFNAYKRTEQVNAVRNAMDRTGRTVILCGDFNDTPASYTYKEIKKEMVDGFKSCGKGYAYTYKGMLRLLRLDYIFYAPGMEGIRYYSPNLYWSDHNPVLLELAFGH